MTCTFTSEAWNRFHRFPGQQKYLEKHQAPSCTVDRDQCQREYCLISATMRFAIEDRFIQLVFIASSQSIALVTVTAASFARVGLCRTLSATAAIAKGKRTYRMYLRVAERLGWWSVRLGEYLSQQGQASHRQYTQARGGQKEAHDTCGRSSSEARIHHAIIRSGRRD